MRECWLSHDKCALNCPCNEECPDGCPEPEIGHPCQTWFCQGELPYVCAAEDDPVRDPCPFNDQYGCQQAGCCWTTYYLDYPYGKVPWCHYPKLDILP